MPKRASISIANRGKILTKSGFNGYDLCINPTVGCEFGCSYCYVRFFVKDEQHEWGEFVRLRTHIEQKLPKELSAGFVKVQDGYLRQTINGELKKKPLYKNLQINNARLVIGTMTDPYQPIEKKYKITRKALEIITSHSNQFNKVGIFTRSPLVLDDIDLITKLPRARVHFTVTPFPPEVLRSIEPYSPITSRRWEVVAALKDAGLRVHANVSPVIPYLSDDYVEEFVAKLIELQVDEYFVDPMQPYKESMVAFREACRGTASDWNKIESTILNKEKYLEWKSNFLYRWQNAREPLQHKAPHQLPIWSDHEYRVWVNMITNEQMDKRLYND